MRPPESGNKWNARGREEKWWVGSDLAFENDDYVVGYNLRLNIYVYWHRVCGAVNYVSHIDGSVAEREFRSTITSLLYNQHGRGCQHSQKKSIT